MFLAVALSDSASESRNGYNSRCGRGPCAWVQRLIDVLPRRLWPDCWKRKRLLVGALLVLLLPLPGLAQSHSAFSVDITVGPAPPRVVADHRTYLLYELHLTIFYARPIELIGFDVLDDGAGPLVSYRGEALEKLLMTVGPSDSAGKARAIGGGRSVVIFLDLTLDSGVRAPTQHRHRLLFSTAGKEGAALEKTVNGSTVTVVQEPVPVLRAPLHGSGWVAFNGLSNGDHRLSFVPFDGREHIAQRFAIDWMRLGSDGRLFHDGSNSNANFYSHGAEVLAVADARVSDLKDGLPENVGGNAESTRSITLEIIAGNYLILDLGRAPD